MSNINFKNIFYKEGSTSDNPLLRFISGMLGYSLKEMRTVGILMADFPGESLISEIIKNNYFYMINKPQLAPVNINKLNKIANDSEEALKKMQKEDPVLYGHLLKTVTNE